MKQIVALIFGLGMIVNAFLFVPQALAIWRKRTAQGVSVLTCGSVTVLALIYGNRPTAS